MACSQLRIAQFILHLDTDSVNIHQIFALSCVCLHIFAKKLQNTGFLSKLIIATTMCSYWSVRLSSFKSVHLISHSFVSSLNAALSLCSSRNKTGTDKKQKRMGDSFPQTSLIAPLNWKNIISRMLLENAAVQNLLYNRCCLFLSLFFCAHFFKIAIHLPQSLKYPGKSSTLQCRIM